MCPVALAEQKWLKQPLLDILKELHETSSSDLKWATKDSKQYLLNYNCTIFFLKNKVKKLDSISGATVQTCLEESLDFLCNNPDHREAIEESIKQKIQDIWKI